MTSFAHKTFSATSYALSRPSYPLELYRKILRYHRGPRNTLLDLGCGHGVVSRGLAPYFREVWGTDPGRGMIEMAKRLSSCSRIAEGEGDKISSGSAKPFHNIRWTQASAENLGFIEDGSLDMIVAGQAAHWFTYPDVWGEFERKLRGGGTVAFWGYVDGLLVGWPEANKVAGRWFYGKEGLGGYWEMPGRGRLRGGYGGRKVEGEGEGKEEGQEMMPSGEGWGDIRRWVRVPGVDGKVKVKLEAEGVKGEEKEGKGYRMRGIYKLGAIEEYWRTYSAFFEWQKANPERKRRGLEGGNGGGSGMGNENEKGDLVDEMIDEILDVEPGLRGGEGQDWRDVEVEMEWETVLLLVRKL